MNHHRSNGFTLIELLIVVAIIGILAAIAVPNFLNAQVRAKVARAQGELKMLANAMTIYIMDNNNRLMPDYNDDAGVKPGGLGNGVPMSFITAPNANPATSYHSLDAWSKLTTPIAYMSSIPTDPFWSGLVYGYDGQRDLLPGFAVKKIHNWIMWSIGPDRVDWQWGRGSAVYYMASNGVNSAGDITITPNYSKQYQQGQVRNY